jgi:hypothetical protein
MRRIVSPITPFKPYIVRRHTALGGCQVLFPLALLDKLVYSALGVALARLDQEHCRGNLAFGMDELMREVTQKLENLEKR